MGIFSNPTLKKLTTTMFVVGLVLVSALAPSLVYAQDGGTAGGDTPPPAVDYSKFKNPVCPPETKSGQTVACKYSPSNVEVQCTLKEYTNPEGPTAREYTCKNPGGSVSVCSTSAGTTSYNICQVFAKEGDTKPVSGTYKDDTPFVDTVTECTSEDCTKSAVVNVPGGDALGNALKGVALFILMLASTFLAWIGMAFNWVVINTIFDFGAIFGASQSMITAWGVMRDVGNIILLFGFILMGVLTILNLHDYPVKKTIPGLIIFAVLLNFSLFASQTVIDVANAFSAIFYEQASARCEAGVDLKDCIKSDNGGISGIIAQQAGITSAMSITEENHLNQTTMGEGIIMLGLALFVTVAAIVLLAATIMLVIRAVVLCFLMVISPIGFAGMAIPPLKGLAKTWWQQLLKQAFFAPVFLLLIFVSLKLTEGISKGVLGPDKGLANALAGGTFGGMGIVVTFMVVIGFMIASLVAASKVGAMGAGFATNFAGAAVLGGMARVTNTAVGGGAWALRQGIQRSPLNKVPGMGLLVGSTLRPLEKANMDLRRVPGMGALLGAAGVTAGAKASEHIAFSDTQHKFHDAMSGKTVKAMNAEYDKEVKENELEGWAHKKGTPEKQNEEMIRYLGKMSTKELEGLHGIKEGLDKLAQNLSPDQFSALMKSDNLSSDEKKKLAAGRFKPLKSATGMPDGSPAELTAKKDAIKAQIKAMSNKDLEQLDPELMGNQLVLDVLSDKQRDHLIGSNGRTPNEIQNIKDSSKIGKLNKAFRAGGIAAMQKQMADIELKSLAMLNAADVAKLEAKAFNEQAVVEQLMGTHLAKVTTENTLTAAEMAKVADMIDKHGTDSAKEYINKHPQGRMWRG